MPPYLGCQCWSSFDEKACFSDAEPTLTHCVRASLVFETLKGYLPDFFDVLYYDKI